MGEGGKIGIDFFATSTIKEATLKHPIAVTKLSFPNLWNYIRLWYFRRRCWAMASFVHVVCFIVSDLVLRYHVAALYTLLKGYIRIRMNIWPTSTATLVHHRRWQFTDAAGVKCFPFQWCEFIGKIIFDPSTIHYLPHSMLSFTHKYRISNGDINLQYDSYHLSYGC